MRCMYAKLARLQRTCGQSPVLEGQYDARTFRRGCASNRMLQLRDGEPHPAGRTQGLSVVQGLPAHHERVGGAPRSQVHRL